jgi:hypothetical protein
MLPDRITTEPNSPTARAKARAAPASRAGAMVGSTIRRKLVTGPAPRQRAASSMSGSMASSTGWTERTTNGRVTKARASTTPGRL